jgi:hypothetical protein
MRSSVRSFAACNATWTPCKSIRQVRSLAPFDIAILEGGQALIEQILRQVKEQQLHKRRGKQPRKKRS